MKKNILSLLIVMAFYSYAHAQGCVAIRTVGGLNTMEHAMMHDGQTSHITKDSSKWDLNISGRYFKSYKHFSGTTENTQRVVDGTDVRNFSHSRHFIS